MFLALLIPLALAALPVLGSANQKRDFFQISWQAYRPQPSGTYEARFDFDSSGWGKLASNEAGFELDTSGEKLGFRLPDDDSSAIIWKLSSNNTVVSDFTETGDGDFEMSLDIDVNFVTTYTSNRTSSTGDSDVWDSTDFVTLPLVGTITAENAGCQSGINITITTLDSIGVKMKFTGTDNVSAPVPVMLPANVTITNDASDDSASMIFNGIQPVSIVTGTGNAPSPRATLDATFQYCPD